MRQLKAITLRDTGAFFDRIMGTLVFTSFLVRATQRGDTNHHGDENHLFHYNYSWLRLTPT